MTERKTFPAAATVGAWLLIGQDRRGLWVVRDALNLCGGIFVNRTEAVRFAMIELQRRPQPVIMASNGLEFEIEPPVSASPAEAA